MALCRLREPTNRGRSCARTLVDALSDTEMKPEVLHVVGVSDAELSLDFAVLASGLAPGARVVLIGPDMAKTAQGQLIGPEERSGLRVSVYTQTYQQYLIHCHDAEYPQFVALFHPGLDVHYFSWYPCLRYWIQCNIPVLVTAFSMPDGIGETPVTVKTILETLVGMGGGRGLWVMEEENVHRVDDVGFNAGFFVFRGSNGELPVLPEELYFQLFQALQKVGHPFAPRVGYLDVGDEADVSTSNPRVLAAIAEGAMRGAKVGADGCDDKTAIEFAQIVLNQALGGGSGETWLKSNVTRSKCPNCGDGFDDEVWHRSICPAVGRNVLQSDDTVVLTNLNKAEYNGKQGTLERFDRQKEKWVVRLGEKQVLIKAINLDTVAR